MTNRCYLSTALAVLLALCALATSLLWLSNIARAQGSTLYVSLDGDCGGASPCYAAIQDAVDAASDGDTVKVAQGMYTGTGFEVVYINKAITLTGGYTTTDWANSYPITRPTVIDAEDVARRRGVYIDGTGVATITLDGLTIQRGYAQDSRGGGIYVLNGTVTLQNSRVLSNTSDSGGGMYVDRYSTATLSDNTFQGNSAFIHGGGVYEYGATVTLSDNTFQNNSASNGGGVSTNRGTVTLSDNTFQGNSAGRGGGVGVHYGAVTLSGNTILSNTASQYGGGIYISGTGEPCTVSGSNDIIADNTSPWEGVYLSGGSLTARHWSLVNNGNYALTTNGGSAVLTDTIVASHTIAGFGGSNIAADHTLFHNSGTPCGGGASCTNNLSGDPKFVNPAAGDYHIGPGSAAFDAGVDARVTIDIDGDPRPLCSGYDVGADELMPSVPAASFTHSAPDWVDQETVFTNTTVVTGCASYLWAFGDGTTSTAISPTHAYTAPGDYTVVLTATNNAGSSVATDTVTLYAAAFTSNSPHQPGHTTVFANTTVSSGTTTYLWSFGDGATSTLESPTHTYASPGSYAVVLTATNFAGFGVVSGTVLVDGTAPIGTIAINSGAIYATSSSVTLTLSASDEGSGVAQVQFSNDGSGWSSWEAYTTAKAWTLPSGDGTKTVYVCYKDNAGNTSGVYSDSIILETVVPTGSVSVNEGATYASTGAVMLTLVADDDTSGIAQMQFSNDGSNWSSWETYATTKSWTLASGDGTKTVYVRYQDNAGNTAVFSDTIILDTTPPSAAVDPLTPYQTSLTFTVSWAGSDAGAGLSSFDVQVRDGDGAWTDWLASTTAASAAFSGLDGHTFYFRARACDVLGNVGAYASGNGDTSTRVDTTRPEGEIAINGGAIDTTSRDVLLILTANGASEMAFSDDGVTFGSWEMFASTRAYELPPGDGLKSVTVRYRDPASNVVEYSDTITLNTSIPGGEGLSINDDATTTDQVTVTLTLKALPGTRQVMVSNSSRFVAAEWEPYATTRTWVLAYHPDASVYQVYAQFRHADGTVSERYDDVITLHLAEPPPPVDSAPPSGSMVINGGTDTTSVPDVTLDVLAADNPGGTGVQWMYFREWKYDPEVVQWVIVRSSGWLPYAESTIWSLAPGTGVKYVGAWFADGANNVSNPVVLDDINLIVPGDTIGEAEVTQYRRTFEPSQQVTVTLNVASGDADLYIWRHGSTGTPDYWSNLAGTATEQVVFTAVEGEYTIEVHGYASSEYTLDIATVGDGGGGGEQGMTAARTVGGLASVASKPLPAQPLVATTPGQAETPDAGPQRHVYLPLVLCHP